MKRYIKIMMIGMILGLVSQETYSISVWDSLFSAAAMGSLLGQLYLSSKLDKLAHTVQGYFHAESPPLQREALFKPRNFFEWEQAEDAAAVLNFNMSTQQLINEAKWKAYKIYALKSIGWIMIVGGVVKYVSGGVAE